ncbi:NAD(P)H-binding protein [Catenulispora sp. NL8]|uniref:NAD(P)H-binding protein n=1 Tax=Catenulispora pinistramenti TaxID=2705254 RepID=A0ABS5L063_9ACTN|nr:NAD(P)H-binding protein [Catenulispora pinistramenti]MBS2551721.1 NAD(P)H-binding protein [Catenulispora pinistramenti]
MANDRKNSSIIVFGAGGRAGRAIAQEALRRGHRAVGVVRDPAKYPGLDALDTGMTVVAGDLTDADSVAAVVSGVSGDVAAVVNAVTPFTAPPETFDDFDADYYVGLVENLSRAAGLRRCRVVEIGLFAMLRTGDVRLFQDEVAFPAFLRPFAVARLRGLNAWADHDADVDWLVLTPPPRLAPDAPSTGRYRLGDDVHDPAATASLSYADLAEAVLDQIDEPTVTRCQAAVYGLP